MNNYNDAARFLQAVFGTDWETKAFLVNSPNWGKRLRLDQLDDTRDCYWCVGAIPWGKARKNSNVENVRALVIDDVGTKVDAALVEKAFGRPTASVITSPGNYQWSYRLSEPVAPGRWTAFFKGAEAAIRNPRPLEGRDAAHLFRLPMGVNTKPDYDAPDVGMDTLDPDVASDASAVTPIHGGFTGPGDGAADRLGLDALRALMKLIPNNLDARDDWSDVGHDLKALCENDEDGFAVFDEWTETWGEPGKGSEYTREKWDSFGAGGLKSKGNGVKARAYAADPAGYARIMNREAAANFDDDPEPPPAPPPGPVQFQLGAQQQILSTMENAARGLRGLGIECSYDEFHHRYYLRRACGKVERLSDDLVLLLRVEINSRYGKDFGPVHILDAIMALGLLHGFNPVVDMLRGAEALWDGVARLDRLGPDYFHTEDSELARACFRKVMLAAVRRARRPGCKFDQILVLESPEGWDKSTAWAVLAGAENFSDADILGKDARAVQEELADIWIHEIADLSGLSRADVEHVKAFASRTNDRARPAYGRVLIDQPRQSIEVGTTNSDSYLLSTTGNRRFWPFKLHDRIDTAALRRDRLQLWGEAAAAESAGETLVLDRGLWDAAGEEQEKRRAVDPWEDELGNLVGMTGVAPVGCERIEDWNGGQFISNLSVHEYLAGYRRQTFHSGSGRKIAEIMKRLGWERCSRKLDGATVRGYKRDAPSVSVTKSVTDNLF